jgi:hypothetical protein
MSNKLSTHMGYLMIDHRDSPGLVGAHVIFEDE